jgi:hypothetical protein
MNKTYHPKQAMKCVWFDELNCTGAGGLAGAGSAAPALAVGPTASAGFGASSGSAMAAT